MLKEENKQSKQKSPNNSRGGLGHLQSTAVSPIASPKKVTNSQDVVTYPLEQVKQLYKHPSKVIPQVRGTYSLEVNS